MRSKKFLEIIKIKPKGHFLAKERTLSLSIATAFRIEFTVLIQVKADDILITTS